MDLTLLSLSIKVFEFKFEFPPRSAHLESLKLSSALMTSSTEPKLSTSDSSLAVSAVMVALLSMLNVDLAMY